VDDPRLPVPVDPAHRTGVLRDPENALDASDDAPGYTSDRAAHDPTDRTGRPIPDRCTLLGPADNTLCLCRDRRGQNEQTGSSK
jgi:hypothetical protein